MNHIYSVVLTLENPNAGENNQNNVGSGNNGNSDNSKEIFNYLPMRKGIEHV